MKSDLNPEARIAMELMSGDIYPEKKGAKQEKSPNPARLAFKHICYVFGALLLFVALYAMKNALQ